jgi:hypothetical protein
MQVHLLTPAGTQSGPHSLEEVRSLWVSGQITLDYRYWQEGLADWKPVVDLEPQLKTRPVQAFAIPMTASWSHPPQRIASATESPWRRPGRSPAPRW